MSNQRDKKGRFLKDHKPPVLWNESKLHYYKKLRKIVKKRKEQNNE